MPALVVVEGACERAVYEVAEDADVTLGRALSNIVVLEDPAVSRRHARVFRIGEDCWAEDLDSSNGTRVNGELIARQALAPGDVLEIGHFRLRFETAVARAEGAEPDSSAVILKDDRDQHMTIERQAERPADVEGAAVLARVDTRKVAAGELAADPESARRKLRIFLAFIDAVGTLLDLDQVLEKAVDSLFEIFVQPERAFVLLADPGTGELTPRAVRNTTPDARDRITVSRTIVEEVMREGKGILMADSASDERFGRAASVINLKIRSAMCVPLVSRNQTYGIIWLDTTVAHARFTEDDLYILAGIGAQAAVAIENANLHTQLVRNKVREHDMARASQVQRNFLPADVPSLTNYEFFVHYAPAFEVGGDFYDFIRLPEGGMAVVLGDVSGKGFSAALLMAKLIGDIRHTALTVSDPCAVLDSVNLMLSRSAGEGTFVTLLYMALEPAAGRCVIVNAGHMAPLVCRAGGALEEPHGASGLPLGVSETTQYGHDLIHLGAGDSVLLYTDGISEARNAEERYYGTDRLRACVADGPQGAAALGQYVLDDVRQFVGGTVQSDDITLVGFGRTP